MSNAAAPAPAAVPDAEDQMAAELAALRQERASDGVAPAPAPSPADAPAPADTAAAPALSQSTDAGNAPAAAPSQAPAAPAPAAAQDPAEQLKQLQTQLQQARSEIGRVGALNRSLTDARAERDRLAQENATLRKAAPSAAQAADEGAAKALEALEARAKEFPELAPLLDTVAAALKATDAKVTASVKESLDKGLAPVVDLQAEANQRRESARVSENQAAQATFQSTYPDAVAVIRSEAFNGWLTTAPRQVQDAFHHGQTPGEAIAVMDAYDAHLRRTGQASIAKFPTAAPAAPAQAPAQQKNNAERLERAAGIASRNTGANGGMPPEDDFEASLEHFRRQRLERTARAA